MSAYFVSDVHLDNKDQLRYQAFLKFLKSLSSKNKTEYLFLMGDIFELWVADHSFFKVKYQDIIDEIRRLVREGVKVYFFEGNHDLYLKRFWQKQLGVRVIGEHLHISLYGKKLRLEHGDLMDLNDKNYLLLRKFWRTKIMTFIAHYFPEFFVKAVSDYSYQKLHNKNRRTPDENFKKKSIKIIRRHAERVYKEATFDLIITGHVHVRDEHQAKNYYSVNLGSWLEDHFYVYELPSGTFKEIKPQLVSM